MPLVRWYARAQGESWSRVLIRSCAVLDPIVRELEYENLVILDREAHQQMARAAGAEGLPYKSAKYEGRTWIFLSIDGFDHPTRYAKDLFEEINHLMQQRLRIGFAAESPHIPSPGTGHLLLIERRPADPYYESSQAEIKSSGAARRSLPNIQELEQALAPWRPLRVSLEGRSLKEQASLFFAADMIIAQHGAALTNILFCRPRTALIEIFSKSLDPNMGRIFEGLALTKSMRYFAVEQETNHSPVELPAIVTAVEKFLPLRKPIQDRPLLCP